MARFTRQRTPEGAAEKPELEAAKPEAIASVDPYSVPPYPDPKNVEEADKLIEQYRAKVEAWNQEIIDFHGRGDHETGDTLRPKLTVLRRDLERLIRQKNIFERA